MGALPAVTLLSDDEFDRLIGAGDPRVRGRVELREGSLRRMNAEHAPHGRLAARLVAALHVALEASALPLEVAVGTVRFGRGFTPLPDALVWRPSAVVGPFPGRDVMLVVEVAGASRADDLGDKRCAYANAGLPEYWVADIETRTFHRFSAPADGDYTRVTEIGDGEPLASDTLPGLAVTVLFP